MDKYSICISDTQIDYTIRQSKKARYVKLVVKDCALHVVIPSSIRLNEKTLLIIENFISQKSGWVLNKLAEIPQTPHQRKLIEDNKIIYLGKTYDIVREQVSSKRKSRVEVNEINHTVTVYDTELGNENTTIHKWYKEKAKEIISARVHELHTHSGKQIKSIRIKDLKTRWGSCSSMGGLNFSWRLIMAPPEVVDYVIIHELSHFNHLNHSERFWKLVESRCPDYKAHVNWLKKEGQNLLHMI